MRTRNRAAGRNDWRNARTRLRLERAEARVAAGLYLDVQCCLSPLTQFEYYRPRMLRAVLASISEDRPEGSFNGHVQDFVRGK